MSNTVAIALISATSFSAFFCFQYVTNLANNAGAEVATGVVGGIPITRTYRGIMLYQVWIGYVTGAVACLILMGFVNLQVAGQVTDTQVKALAYLGAAMGAVGSLGVLLNSISALVHFRSLLRQAEAR
jgi:hypothetical protein